MARTLQVESINSSLTGLDLTTAGVSRLFITNSGNVGINTITASTLFEVNGDVTISDKIIHAGDTNTFIRFVTSDTVSIDTAGSERMRITSNGGIAFGGAANYGTTAHVLKSAGDSAPVWGFISNANVDSAAAIAYSKLALGTSIVNADISATAGIVDTKLATISTALKVSNSATTATSTNTASAIVARDASNNFVAGTITAALAGNATTATTANALNTANTYQVNGLGVGTAASATAGEIRATNNITAYYSASDKRLKENITPLKNVLKKLENINGYNFNYKTRPNQKMVGIIAQELLEEYPELIYETAPIDEGTGLDKIYAVRYELLTSILLQAIKELSLEVEKLKHK